MQFDSWSELMTMGGHGVYVWSVYCVALIVMLYLVINPMLKNRRFFLEQSMKLRRERMLVERNENKPVERAESTDHS